MTVLGSLLETLSSFLGRFAVSSVRCLISVTVWTGTGSLQVVLVFWLTVGVLAVAQAFHPPVRWFVSAILILGGGSLIADCMLTGWKVWRKHHDRS